MHDCFVSHCILQCGVLPKNLGWSPFCCCACFARYVRVTININIYTAHLQIYNIYTCVNVHVKTYVNSHTYSSHTCGTRSCGTHVGVKYLAKECFLKNLTRTYAQLCGTNDFTRLFFGVATISWLLKILGLFCRISSLL